MKFSTAFTAIFATAAVAAPVVFANPFLRRDDDRELKKGCSAPEEDFCASELITITDTLKCAGKDKDCDDDEGCVKVSCKCKVDPNGVCKDKNLTPTEKADCEALAEDDYDDCLAEVVGFTEGPFVFAGEAVTCKTCAIDGESCDSDHDCCGEGSCNSSDQCDNTGNEPNKIKCKLDLSV